MYRSLEDSGRRLPFHQGRVLTISHSANLVSLLGLQPSELVEANYPEFNLLKLNFPNDSFDFILSDQVLEHVRGNPQTAIDESHRVLKPGGIAVHTTCFINPIHDEPHDYWRFTPEALRFLHESWTETIEVGAWGNRQVWSLVDLDGMRYTKVPLTSWHPLYRIAVKNEWRWPIVTWVIARK